MATLTSQSALETILNHRSIRKFTEQAIDDTTFDTLIQAGLAGSSSGFLQSASVIRITDKTLRAKIRRICANVADDDATIQTKNYGHAYVENCAEFLLFCMDNQRHHTLVPTAQTDWTEVTLVGAIDSAIMAQNILVSAESLGLGGVYIGSVRNDIDKLSQLLQLPKHVVLLFGMCLGYPAQDPTMRPRLPVKLVLSTNHYQPADKTQLLAYNDTMKAYYTERGQADMDWVKQIQTYFDQPSRPRILPYLNQQGYAKR